MWHQQGELVGPCYPDHGYKLKWDCKPFIAEIDEDKGIIPHRNPEAPDTKCYLAAAIDQTQFFRHAEYLASNTIIGAMFDRICDQVWLVSEEDDGSIYVIITAKGLMFILGKMVESNIVYQRCKQAFGSMLR